MPVAIGSIDAKSWAQELQRSKRRERVVQNYWSGSIQRAASRAKMNREYFKGDRQELHRDMESLGFGHAGDPLLVFPSSISIF
jgi:hypothetical protein